MHQTFQKNERLKSKRAFELLFAEGKSVKHFPLRVVFIPWQGDTSTGIQVAFSVPKRRFKNAVDRNRIKRQMREAYRLQKAVLTKTQQHLALVFIYLPATKVPYARIEEAMAKCLQTLAEKQ